MGRAKVKAPSGLFLPYQEKWVKDRSRIKLGEKSRQIGWTWCSAYGIVRRKSLKTAALDAWISSRDDMQARLFLEDLKAFANILKTGAKYLGEQVIDEDKNTAYVLGFANGLRAHSMSSNPDAQAGKRGDRVLDEFALHPDPRKLYAIAQPGITWGGQLEMFSTHRGSQNFFNELIGEVRHKDNPKNISLHRVTLEDALNEGFLDKLQSKLPADDERQEMDETDYFNAVRSESADEESFLQEYMCVPADDKSAFLTYDDIAACEYSLTEDWEMSREQLAKAGDLYIGVDIGREHDLTVIWILERIGGVFFTRKVIELKKEKFSTQESVLYPFLELPNVRRCCIDRNGLGRQFAERGRERFGYRVEEVNFTSGSKEEMAYPTRAHFEDRTVKIPNDKFIRADLRSIKKEMTQGGNVRFAADRGKNGHADRFWALALGLHAGAQKVPPPPPVPPMEETAHSRVITSRGNRELMGV